MKTKHVVITGVTRGLGLAMVEGFHALGWKISGLARDPKKIEELKKRFSAEDSYVFQAIDVSSDAEVKKFCEKVLEEQGPPDLLLNNAAIVTPNAPLWEQRPEDIQRILDVNIKGVISMIRGFTSAMLKQEKGVIVNFSSGWGRSTSPDVAPYCATKFAIEGLSKAMASETGSKVTVVALNPGIIDTDMLRTSFGPASAGFPSPETWAKLAIPFLLSLSAKDNGKSLTVPVGNGNY